MDYHITNFILALAVGAGVGFFFFTGLWQTIQHIQKSENKAMWLILSSLLRFCVTLTVFYIVSRGHWESLLACLAGFMITRTLFLRRMKLSLNYKKDTLS